MNEKLKQEIELIEVERDIIELEQMIERAFQQKFPDRRRLKHLVGALEHTKMTRAEIKGKLSGEMCTSAVFDVLYIHDFPEPEGLKAFPSTDIPVEGELIILPSTGEVVRVANVAGSCIEVEDL